MTDVGKFAQCGRDRRSGPAVRLHQRGKGRLHPIRFTGSQRLPLDKIAAGTARAASSSPCSPPTSARIQHGCRHLQRPESKTEGRDQRPQHRKQCRPCHVSWATCAFPRAWKSVSTRSTPIPTRKSIMTHHRQPGRAHGRTGAHGPPAPIGSDRHQGAATPLSSRRNSYPATKRAITKYHQPPVSAGSGRGL
jgi:hypothetical protein